MRRSGEGLSACGLPLGVHLFASQRSRAAGISLQDVLLAQRRLLFDIEPEDSGIPPYDGRPASTRPVEARSNRSSWRRNAIAAAVQDAVVAEDRTPGRGTSYALGVLRRIKDWLEYVEPACDRCVATDRRDQEGAGARGRHIGNSYRFRPVAAQFLLGSLKDLHGRAAA